jgi:aldehyde:ferredoxin oxidoreductase
VLFDEVAPRCNPLGAENMLIFAPGLLGGTSVINSGRLSIGAKSPLTGTIKESNVGGTAGSALARLRIAAVIVEGKAPLGETHFLKIGDQAEASLIPADRYRGWRTYALTEELLRTHGAENAVLSVGPAGEQLLLSASIQASDVDGRPCRAAGRGGLGAVMSSKGLKALIIDKKPKPAVRAKDPATFTLSARKFSRAVREAPFSGKVLPENGTAALVAMVNSLGAFPTRNARDGVFEGWPKISGEQLAKIIRERGGKTKHQGCSQCIISCSNVFVDDQSRYVTSSLEYETLWAVGGMCGIDDLDAIARMDYLCDDIGLDTMNTGVALAVAMDAGHGRFGDPSAAVAMLEEIGQGSEFGCILGNGPAAVGRHFNHPRVPVCKNQSIAAYDPRAIQGMAVTYASSPMGADHTAGNLIGESLAGIVNPLSREGQVEASRKKQLAAMALDFTGLCLFTGSALKDEILRDLVNARLGSRYTIEDLKDLFHGVLQKERAFNRKAGLDRRADRLTEFFYTEPLPPHNQTVRITDEDLDSVFGPAG